MDNKLNNMLNEFFANTDAKDEKELNEKLQEFMKNLNEGDFEYENTPLDDAYELLEEAENARGKKQALKLAQKAYETCEACFDAIIFQAELENSSIKKREILDKGLAVERRRLEKEKYFEKDNIGHFYGIFETRPYIRGLHFKAELLVEDGKMGQAEKVCKEILKLNKNDNTGIRYLLMAIYAYLENEKELLKLYKEYQQEDFMTLFPLFAFYYKQEDTSKTLEYLNLIDKANPNFIKYYYGAMEINGYDTDEYYEIGDGSEIITYFNNYSFLVDSIPNIDEYIKKGR